MKTLRVATGSRQEMVDVTDRLRELIRGSGVPEGVCLVFSPHTTCAVTVNEGWDPDVQRDVLHHLAQLIPREGAWAHAEGNSDAHVKSVAVGPSVLLPVSDGELRLGRWQAVFLCEFDGPRERELWATVVGATAARFPPRTPLP